MLFCVYVGDVYESFVLSISSKKITKKKQQQHNDNGKMHKK